MLYGLLCRRQLGSTSPAQIYKPQQRFVLFLSQLLQRTIAGLLHYPLGDGLLQFSRNLGITESLHQARQRAHQVIHEVLNPAFPTADVPQQAWTHHSPTKSRPPTHGVICIGNTQNTLFNQIHNLSIQSSLQSVSDMSE